MVGHLLLLWGQFPPVFVYPLEVLVCVLRPEDSKILKLIFLWCAKQLQRNNFSVKVRPQEVTAISTFIKVKFRTKFIKFDSYVSLILNKRRNTVA